MQRYLAAFYRHPLILIAPIVIAIAGAATYALAQPRQYTATASMWFSPSQPNDATGNVVLPDTSSGAKAVSVFNEFLKSRSFDIQVGRDGGLTDYYAANPPSSQGLNGLIRRVAHKVGLAGAPAALSGDALDDQAASTVSSGVTISSPGPQLVVVSVTAPSASAAAKTAMAVFSAFSDQVVAAHRAVLQNDVRYYQASSDDAAQAVKVADAALAQYISAHPRNEVVPVTDLTETGLVSAVTVAQQRAQAASDHLSQSKLALDGVATATGFHVVDAAQTPDGPQSIARRVLLSIIGGLFAGLILSLGLLIAFVSADRTMRTAADVERELGLRVGSSIEHIRSLATRGN